MSKDYYFNDKLTASFNPKKHLIIYRLPEEILMFSQENKNRILESLLNSFKYGEYLDKNGNQIKDFHLVPHGSLLKFKNIRVKKNQNLCKSKVCYTKYPCQTI